MHSDSNYIYDIPKVIAESPFPVIPLIADKDGMWYLYTIWHMERAVKIMGV